MKAAINIIVGIITVAMELLTLLTIIAAYIPASEIFAAFSIFVIFFPAILIINILLLLHWIFSGKVWMSLSLIIVLLLSLPQVSHIVSLSPDIKCSESSNGIKLLSCNVKFFGFSNDDCEQTLKYINSSGADIVCMQEFGYYKNKQPTFQSIKSRLRKYPYIHISEGTGTPKGIQKHVVTFSKYKIIQKKEIDLMSPYHSALVSYIKIGDDTLRLFNCYLESNKLTPDEKQLDDEESLQNIFKKISNASAKRWEQAKKIVDEIGSEQKNTIVCGDLNDVPNSRTYNVLRGNMNDAFISLRRGLGITFHENIYNFRIDYIFASKDIRLLNFTLDRQDISDHYPIIAAFDLNN